MPAARDPIALVEACYDQHASEDDWLLNVARRAEPLLKSSELIAYHVDLDDRRVAIRAPVGTQPDGEALARIRKMAALLERRSSGRSASVDASERSSRRWRRRRTAPSSTPRCASRTPTCDARDALARELLTARGKDVDRARTRASGRDVTALEVWQGLVDGRCELYRKVAKATTSKAVKSWPACPCD